MIEMLKHRKSIGSALYNEIQKMDVKNRFLTDHVMKMSSWFQLRAPLGGLRAKSISIMSDPNRPLEKGVLPALKQSLDNWFGCHLTVAIDRLSGLLV